MGVEHMDTAIILAGGKSKRMGLDKQFLMVDDQWMLEHIAEQLKPLFKKIIIVSNKPEQYQDCPYRVVQDQFKDFGPVAGIHAGLKYSSSRYNYIIACDMPFVNIPYIQYMQKIIRDSPQEIDAVITKFGEWLEPFNAFYSKSLIRKIEKNIEQGKRRVAFILEGSNVIYIEEKKARVFSPGWEMFMNLNTPEDLESYLACIDGGKSYGCCKQTPHP